MKSALSLSVAKLVASTAILFACEQAPAQTPNFRLDLPTQIKTLRPSVVEVFVDGKRSGSGFIVSTNGYIITATHVVGDLQLSTTGTVIPKYRNNIEIVLNDKRRLLAKAVPNYDQRLVFSDITMLKVGASHFDAGSAIQIATRRWRDRLPYGFSA